jgi:hypothetical protein
MKYTLEWFFWECRAIFSTILVLIFFYHVRLIDSVLKHLVEHILTKKIELRVEIEDLVLDLWNKECVMHGAIIYHPTIKEDPRWHYEYLAHAKSISFSFDPIQSLYAFCYSRFSLMYVDEIVVKTIDLYVEGFEDIVYDSEGNVTKKKLLINLELLGGIHVGKKKRKKRPTQAELKAIQEKQNAENQQLQWKEEEKVRQQQLDRTSRGIQTHSFVCISLLNLLLVHSYII